MTQNNQERRPGFVNSKYAFTGETKTVDGHVLHRIEAIRDVGHVKKGTKGGFIEFPINLSPGGDCWVGDEAIVYGPYAKILGDAIIREKAIVTGPVKISGFVKILGKTKITGTDDNWWYRWYHNEKYYEILIWGNTTINGNSVISGKNIRIQDSSLSGGIKVKDNTHITYKSQISGNVNLKGVKLNNTTISAKSGEKISVVDTHIEYSQISGTHNINKKIISCKIIQ